MNFKGLYGPNVAIVGASSDKTKFSNKALRAFQKSGYNVFAVNPTEKEVEGLKCYKQLSDIKEQIDIVSLYMNPDAAVSARIPEQMAKKKIKAIILNPGTESQLLLKRLKDEHIEMLMRCSIRSLGFDPATL